MASGSQQVVDAVRALPGARDAAVAGNRPLVLAPGELAVVAGGVVDAVFVPQDEQHEPRTPVLVAELGLGELVVGGWERDASGLPAGFGAVRGLGEAAVVVARAPDSLDPPLADPAAEWRSRVQAFESAGSVETPAEERSRLEARRALDDELDAAGRRALLQVFLARPLSRRPHGLPPPVAALADAAADAGAAIDRARLESVARMNGSAATDVTELAARLRVPARRVTLAGSWWREKGLPLVAFLDGQPVALLPRRHGYRLRSDSASPRRVSAADAAAIDSTAYAVYPKLPDRPLTGRDLLRLGFSGTRRSLVGLLLLTVAVAGLGAFVPYATAQIVGSIVPSGNRAALADIVIAVGVFTVAMLAASIAQALAVVALSTSASARLTAALWDRLLHVSPSFFRTRSAGELAQQVTAFDQMRNLVSSTLVAGLAGSALALAGIVLAIGYSVPIGLVVVVVFAVAMIVAGATIRVEGRWLSSVVSERNRLNGLLLGLFSGVSKLRVAGAERRAHAVWAQGYAFQQEAQRNASFQGVRLSVLQGLLSGLLLLAVIAAAAAFGGDELSVVDFTGSVAAAGQLAAAAGSIIAVATTLVQLRPLYRSTRPILDTAPEVREAATLPGEFTGALELGDVTFGYADGAPVLDRVSLEVAAGSFVAIVGPSGAGKSTILRLLLGFERPWEGEVRLDGKDLARLDLEGVRRAMGTVIQGARITSGTILTNILGALPLGVDAAWEAAELAGIAEDIRAMPMRMSTMVPEGGSGFSGGQLQRLLLARALVRKPRILMLDEATSALDNETQKVVSENLAALGVSRVVVAHRLSTIRHADKIVVLDHGRVVEQGPFDELVAAGGLFAALAGRQML